MFSFSQENRDFITCPNLLYKTIRLILKLHFCSQFFVALIFLAYIDFVIQFVIFLSVIVSILLPDK